MPRCVGALTPVAVSFAPMRLSKIKIAGFKSFVDPTPIKLPSNLIGVVGPNGCGKSNIIDAVRWVLGETSAKHLRGGAMADVVFNGSSARQPVGQASVELVFDNSDGKIGGEYAKFSDIAIRREVTRDGQSNYFLNGARCRRRDITDLFLGTGLGPRSYAIIEQGMISRVIDARPEELRGFLEEAAGISKYKERRRDTENRIGHTRENLERLNDLRDALDKQLDKLRRQAQVAERYQALREQAQAHEGQLLAIRLRDLAREGERSERRLMQANTQLESALADQRGCERDLETQRQALQRATDDMQAVQARYYQVGSDIARQEQALQHAQDLQRRQREELDNNRQSVAELDEHLRLDEAEAAALAEWLADHEPRFETLVRRREQADGQWEAAEAAMQAWQQTWTQLTQALAEPTRAAEVQLSRIDQFERQLKQYDERGKRLAVERATLDPGLLEADIATLLEQQAALETQEGAFAEQVAQLQQVIHAGREDNHHVAQRLDEARRRDQELKGRLASLRALQDAALGRDDQVAARWLAARGLGEQARLGETLRIDAAWASALETVLGHDVQAVLIDDLARLDAGAEALPQGQVTLIEAAAVNAADGVSAAGAALLDAVQCEYDLSGLLGGVGCAATLAEALAGRSRLTAGQSVVTRDGYWVGPNWLRILRDPDHQAGVLRREQAIRALHDAIRSAEQAVRECSEQLRRDRDALRERETQRDAAQTEWDGLKTRLGEIKARLGGRQARLESMLGRLRRLDQDEAALREEQARDVAERDRAAALRTTALTAIDALSQDRAALEPRAQTLKTALAEARLQQRNARDAAQALALEIKSKQAARQSLAQTIERAQLRRQRLEQQLQTLRDDMEATVAPLAAQRQTLERQLAQRAGIDGELTAARRAVEQIGNGMREQEQRRHGLAQAVQAQREVVNAGLVERKALEVRAGTLREQFPGGEIDLDAVSRTVPDDATESAWSEALAALARRIERLGPINLAAVDEYAAEQARKGYLDSQHDDLTQALATLEAAIRKMDRETRTRFKATFDQVNRKVGELFPSLFGGGHACLELTEDDLLNAGVTIMAQPPGKKNSTIQLLSGGEKALTAVSLVFALFELNPAPFCMLDEVDAPLDDANVARFSRMLTAMSERVQFVFISHNKITMEIANELLGVTMHEPGVSRLVAVDINAAAQLAGR